jgi:hypothetical protein
MRAGMLSLIVMFAACSSATGPGGLDPTVLVTNPSSADTVFFTWRDGQGVVAVDTILGPTTRCEHFTARPDSAAFELLARHWYSTGPAVSWSGALWFNPADHPAWTALYEIASGILVKDVSPAVPC